MEPTDKNKPKDNTGASIDQASTKVGSDPLVNAGGSEPPAVGEHAAAQPDANAHTPPLPHRLDATADAGSNNNAKSDTSAAKGPGVASEASAPINATKASAAAGEASGASASRGSGAGSAGSVPPSPPQPRKGGSSGGRGLASLALLIALAAGGFSLWQWYQERASDDDRNAELTQRLDRLEQAQRESSQTQAQQLQNVPSAGQVEETRRLVDDLQRSQRQLRNRLEEQGDARADWKLAEAEYLLRLASLRLMAAQDVRSARDMLEAVDQILRDQPDSGVFAVREALARVQAELSALPDIDRAGIYLRLAALYDQVDRLVALPVPEFDPDERSVEEEYQDRLARRTWAERMLMRLERYVRVDFQRGKVITPLLDEAEMQRIHRTLQLTLEQAQWAALRGEGTIYRRSIERAEEVLEQFFEMDNQQVQAMSEQLSELAERQVSLTPPDLAPVQRALADYVDRQEQGSGNADREATDE